MSISFHVGNLPARKVKVGRNKFIFLPRREIVRVDPPHTIFHLRQMIQKKRNAAKRKPERPRYFMAGKTFFPWWTLKRPSSLPNLRRMNRSRYTPNGIPCRETKAKRRAA